VVHSQEVLVVWKSKLAEFEASNLPPTGVIPSQEDFLRVKVVSFDLFDTLIYRKSISHYQMWRNESRPYFLRRAMAEFVARVVKRIKGIPEVSESDIYNRMPKRWDLEFEIGLELENLLPNPVTINLLKKAIYSGGSVCIISDTHYRESDVKRFLTHLRIPEVKIFTSSEYGLTKSTGLFGEVQKQLGVSFTDWIHIGDNLHSDVVSPKNLGIRSFHYPSMKSQLIDSGLISPDGYKFLRKSKEQGIRSISAMFTNLLAENNKGVPGVAEFPRVLGSIMGDLVSTAIAKEIHTMYNKEKYDCILYSSRDGWLPFIAHQRLFPNDPIQYFKTSRRMLEDPNFGIYLSSIIGNAGKVLVYDLGWRGSTARAISSFFSEKNWDYVYWQLLGKKKVNQIELNPGTALNRLRMWRSRDLLESIFTDSSKGYDQISIDLRPIEREELFGSEFKDAMLMGAKSGIEHHSNYSNLKIASLTLEAICRYPSRQLIKFAEGYSHQINPKSDGLLVVTSWKDLLGKSRVLWPYGSKSYSENKFSKTAFAIAVLLKEVAQRGANLIARLRQAI
jgi:FMN phosphatase YigB (HAD superfamily)